jgi:hypothetical protein
MDEQTQGIEGVTSPNTGPIGEEFFICPFCGSERSEVLSEFVREKWERAILTLRRQIIRECKDCLKHFVV